jgi:hypothetical protein
MIFLLIITFYTNIFIKNSNNFYKVFIIKYLKIKKKLINSLRKVLYNKKLLKN